MFATASQQFTIQEMSTI